MKNAILTILLLVLLSGIAGQPLLASETMVETPSSAMKTTPGTSLAAPKASFGERALALGFTLDLLPTVLSATDSRFGMSGQVWVGIDAVRLRLVGARMHMPDWLAANNGFRNQRTTVAAGIVDYCFGKHFDEWWIGTGFELWLNEVDHRDAAGRTADWENIVWTVGGGYIWRFWNNLYIEPWAAAHVMLNRPEIALAGKTYDVFPVTGEVSLKIGWFLDL